MCRYKYILIIDVPWSSASLPVYLYGGSDGGER